MKRKDQNAVALGKRARGVPKQYSPEELERRKARLAEARAKRWVHKAAK